MRNISGIDWRITQPFQGCRKLVGYAYLWWNHRLCYGIPAGFETVSPSPSWGHTTNAWAVHVRGVELESSR